MTVRRVGERYVTDQPGVRTWSAFSSGPHYDPANVSFGPVVGCDEHLVEAEAGFDRHAHRGVVIVSWVLAGTLRHEGDDALLLDVGAGELLVQSTGDGIRHRETNPSTTEPLRFVQTTLLLDLGRSVGRLSVPARVGGVAIDLRPAATLQAGDTMRDERTFTVAGTVAGRGVELVLDW